MKKLLLAIMLLLPVCSLAAKKNLILHCDSINGPSEYKDSIVQIKMSMAVYYDVTLVIFSEINERITIEWENARINGANIAFFTDNEYERKRPKPDEVLTAKGVSVKTICKRSFLDIVDKKKIKKGEAEYFSLILPLKIGTTYKDLKIRIYVTLE